MSPPGFVQQFQRWARREPALSSRLIMLAGCLLIAQTKHTLVGGVPLSQHLKIMGILAAWGVVSFFCQQLMKLPSWTDATRFLWAGLDVLFFSLILYVNEDIQSHLVVAYALLIVGAGLWFRVPLVWYTAGLCTVSYRAAPGRVRHPRTARGRAQEHHLRAEPGAAHVHHGVPGPPRAGAEPVL